MGLLSLGALSVGGVGGADLGCFDFGKVRKPLLQVGLRITALRRGRLQGREPPRAGGAEDVDNLGEGLGVCQEGGVVGFVQLGA